MSMPKQTSEDRELRVRLTALARADDGPMVGEVPESWLLNPKFRCVNFHVPSTSTLIPSQPVAPRLEETTDDAKLGSH